MLTMVGGSTGVVNGGGEARKGPRWSGGQVGGGTPADETGRWALRERGADSGGPGGDPGDGKRRLCELRWVNTVGGGD